MTTKAQLKKAALGLPETEEDAERGLPVHRVRENVFAALSAPGQAELQLPASTIADLLKRHPTAIKSGSEVIELPLADVNGMELNSLVYRAWLHRAPAELAEAARAAKAGKPAADSEHGLPATIGRPATRALLLAGISTLEEVARHTEEELLALHGVGPRAIRLLGEALAARKLDFRHTD